MSYYVELHRGLWRVRVQSPSDKKKYVPYTRNDDGERFASEEEADEFGRYQVALIKRGKWLDPKAPKITFEEWAAIWYAGLALEPSTMRKYLILLERHLIPVWGHRTLASITAQEMAPWERNIVRADYAERTAYDCRSLLITILNAAVPVHIPLNPALRPRGTGKKATRRVARALKEEKPWTTPLQALLVAERAALLAGDMDVFAMLVTKAWTGMRWSEVLGVRPESLLPGQMLHVKWKLYELGGFYWGYPKDGSIRKIHLPPFLHTLLTELAKRARACGCSGRDKALPAVDGEESVEWCPGRRALFLTSSGSHYGRGDFSDVMRPAADGFYPARTGRRARPPRPVVVQVGGGDQGDAMPFPGRPLRPAWPYAARPPEMAWAWEPIPEEFVMPRRRGQWSFDRDDDASRQIATWLPLVPGLTPHGMRHGHQTWMDDAGIRSSLKKARMGHEDASMSALYGHITEGMVTDLLDLLEGLWESAVQERFQIHPRSPVPLLDRWMEPWRAGTASATVTPIRRAG
ncbi:hypothetical protein [Nonomuraea sp. NPDC050310]|uniref:hypothetical protein n=1 Tax=Nonomuraea sp. NPDC050310 TaxID=3154935 RepID=UPI0034119E07